jgi:predicted DNA-binding protein with PD1-like motif
MKTKALIRLSLLIAIFGICVVGIANAQEYVSPTKPVVRGRSPGVKVKLLSDSGSTRTYIMVYSPGDEVLSGLYDFAEKYHVKSAHFTALGDAKTARLGWFVQSTKLFKVNVIDKQSEITSMIGDIAIFNGKPVVHAHVNLAAEDGTVRGGHLLEAFVSPTLEIIITVEPATLYKKFSTAFGGALIDPEE